MHFNQRPTLFVDRFEKKKKRGSLGRNLNDDFCDQENRHL